MVLLRPVNSMFMLTLGRPYFTSSISAFAGFVISVYAVLMLDTAFSAYNLFMSVLLFVFGTVIAYCILVIFASMAFVLIDSKTIVRIPEVFLFNYKNQPHQIYYGVARYIFWFVLPVVFMVSIPAEVYLKGLDWPILVIASALTVVFFALTISIWKYMIRQYSSAGG